jgi:hypothetical protein
MNIGEIGFKCMCPFENLTDCSLHITEKPVNFNQPDSLTNCTDIDNNLCIAHLNSGVICNSEFLVNNITFEKYCCKSCNFNNETSIVLANNQNNGTIFADIVVNILSLIFNIFKLFF